MNDKLIWGEESSGQFSTKSAYDMLTTPADYQGIHSNWLWIWKLKGPNKLKHFLWLAAHNNLMTNEMRFIRHKTDSPSCYRCHIYEENVLHVLRDCPKARLIWERFIDTSIQTDFFNASLTSCLQNNSTSHKRDLSGRIWSLCFLAIALNIWKTHNREVISNHQSTLTEVMHLIFSLIDNLHIAFDPHLETPSPPPRLVKWFKPPQGYVKINTDGSCYGNPGPAAVGGLFRND